MLLAYGQTISYTSLPFPGFPSVITTIAQRAPLAATVLPWLTPFALVPAIGANIVTPTTNAAFTVAVPVGGRIGDLMLLTIRNASGGALGASTPAAGYRLAGAALPNPTDTNSLTVAVEFNGTEWVEVWRGATAIPN